MATPKRIHNQPTYKRVAVNTLFALDNAVTPGNTLYVIAVAPATVTGALSISDNQGNSYLPLGSTTTPRCSHWACAVNDPDQPEITVSGTGSGILTVLVIELSGVSSTATPVLKTGSSTTPNADPIQVNSIGGLVIAWTAQISSGTVRYTMGDGWSIDPKDYYNTGPDSYIVTENTLNVIPGSRYTPSFTQNSSTNWVCGAVLFLPVVLTLQSAATAIENFVNVKDPAYGAIGDAREFFVAIDVTSPSFLKSSAFLSTDEGRRIDVIGAGPNNTVLTAMILSVTTTGSNRGATLSMPSSITADLTNTLVSLGADDTTSLRSAILALPPSQGTATATGAIGGICYFPPGNYKCYSIPTYGEVTLQGNRNGSTITATPPSNVRGAVEIVCLLFSSIAIEGARIRDLTINAHQGHAICAYNPSQPPPELTSPGSASIPAGTYTFQYTYVVNAPASPLVAAVALTGSALPPGSYYVVTTYLNAFGETNKSTPSQVTILANQKIRVTSPDPSGNATVYKVYVGTSLSGKYFYLQAGNANGALLGADQDITTYVTTGRPLVPIVNSTGYGAVGSEAASIMVDGSQNIQITAPPVPSEYTGITVYLVARTTGSRRGIVGTSVGNSLTLGALNPQPAAPDDEVFPRAITLHCEVADCILSGGNTAVYFRAPSIYTQWTKIERNLFQFLGSGAIAIDGNVNAVQYNDIETPVRGQTGWGTFTRPIGFFEIRGSKPLIQGNIVDVANGGTGNDAIAFFVGQTQHIGVRGTSTGEVLFLQNYSEPAPSPYIPLQVDNGVGNPKIGRAYQFDRVDGLDCDNIMVQSLAAPASSATAFFDHCSDVRIRRLFLSPNNDTDLSHFLLIDPADVTTYIRIGVVRGNFTQANFDKPNILVDSYYSTDEYTSAFFKPMFTGPNVKIGDVLDATATADKGAVRLAIGKNFPSTTSPINSGLVTEAGGQVLSLGINASPIGTPYSSRELFPKAVDGVPGSSGFSFSVDEHDAVDHVL